MFPVVFFLLFFSCSLKAETKTDEILKMLQAGNERFIHAQTEASKNIKEQRGESAKGQNPKVAVLACADSRVAPEWIFDQGLGKLFVIRVAGQVLGNVEVETLRFGVFNFNIPLIVVLGHQKCGAIEAKSKAHVDLIPQISSLVTAKIESKPGEVDQSLDDIVKEHIKNTVENVKQDPALKPLIEAKRVKVVGGFYYLESGRVEFL